MKNKTFDNLLLFLGSIIFITGFWEFERTTFGWFSIPSAFGVIIIIQSMILERIEKKKK